MVSSAAAKLFTSANPRPDGGSSGYRYHENTPKAEVGMAPNLNLNLLENSLPRTHYILDDDKNLAPCNALTWATWLERADRKVGRTVLFGCTVSTVFLGLNHNLDDDSPPLVFETMVFGGVHDQTTYRWSNWREAEAMHQLIVDQVAQTPGLLNLWANVVRWIGAQF